MLSTSREERTKYINDRTNYNADQQRLLELANKNLLASKNVHSAFQSASDELLKNIIKARCSQFSVGLFNLRGDKNVGTIIRSGESFGASEFVLFGDPSFDVRSAVGCHARNTIVYAMKDYGVADIDENRIPQFVSYVTKNNKFPIFIEQGGIDICDVKWQTYVSTSYVDMSNECNESYEGEKQIMFVFGNEATGIDPNIYKYFPDSPIVSISTCGLVRSLNVACCASIIFYDFYSKMQKFRNE
jgi:tRNA G18 (ribose-2'-O)-methylase SpoU